MDYDGNDFQSQNFQLSGEDNSKFSSGLRSFSLPKFELDEQFQVHLRFDSLVEPESLLGIQDQEESNWIDNFSSGNGSLGFATGAAEPCPILRRKNVWSEATSSESVEILLRSVGEDDLISNRNHIFDLDSHNGLSSISNHMDPSSLQDSSLQVDEAKANADFVVPAKDCVNDLAGTSTAMTADLPKVEEVRNTFNDEDFGNEIFEELDEGCKEEKTTISGDLPEKSDLKETMASVTCETSETKTKGNSFVRSSTHLILHDAHIDTASVKKDAATDPVTSPASVVEGSHDVTLKQIVPSTCSVDMSTNNLGALSPQNFSEQVTGNYHEDVSLARSEELVINEQQNMEFVIAKEDDGHKNEPSRACGINHGDDVLEGSSNLQSRSGTSSLIIGERNESVASEKSDGLLEDVAHQIETLSKGNVACLQNTTEAQARAACDLVTESGVSMGGVSVTCSSEIIMLSASLRVDSFGEVKKESVAACEATVRSEKDRSPDNNVASQKYIDLTEHSEDKRQEKHASAIITEENVDNGKDLPESIKNAENYCSSADIHDPKSKHCETQGMEEEKDASLGMHPPDVGFCAIDAGGITVYPEEQTLDTKGIACDMQNVHSQVVEECANPPNTLFEDCESTQVSHSLDTRSSENCDSTLELQDEDSVIQVSQLPEGEGAEPSSNSDNDLVSHTDPKVKDDSAQDQNTQILSGNMEEQPSEDSTPKVTGDTVDFQNNSLQSVSPSTSPEPHFPNVESSSKPRCGSPTIISSSLPPADKKKNELTEQLPDGTLPVSDNVVQPSSKEKMCEEDRSVDVSPKESNVSEERSFTFEVRSIADVPEGALVGRWKPFPAAQSCEMPKVEEICSSIPSLKQDNPKMLDETPTTVKSSHKDKTKSASGSLNERSATSKRKSAKASSMVKEMVEKEGTRNAPVNVVCTTSKDMQLGDKYQYPFVGVGLTSSCPPSVQTSKLPDLNGGAAFFHQPFTDMQQVQLRAQIFVYGSLIQGVPPDEACMVSAFGNSDGARNMWESIWRVTLERFHNQKPSLTNFDTPLHSHSGVRSHEQGLGTSPLQSKSHATPVSRTNSKVASTVVSSFMSLPSPLWNAASRDISVSNVSRGLSLDPSQILSPLHGYQFTHGKQYTGSVNPWLSQAVSPVPWLASSTSATLDSTAQHLSTAAAETVHLTPIRDSTTSQSSNHQFATPISFQTSAVPSTELATSTTQVETLNQVSSLLDKNTTGNQKTRKRRKSSVVEVPLPPVSQPRVELDSATAVTKHPSTSNSEPAITSTVSPTHFHVIASQGKEQKVILSEETCSKIEQAKLQAEDAAAFSVAAIRQMEGIWSQLAAQRNSGLGSEIEIKLASAAVAAAAASSVAKAAAAAAKVASDAAMQAKMMADEALSNRVGNSIEESQNVCKDQRTAIPKFAPLSSSKVKEKNNTSTSVIFAAKEAARRRVEAASAASKRAENLDAIVKAAELAAVAVCQAGAVIAMGDPLPFTLSDLIDAGPEGYWKAQQSSAEHTVTVEHEREQQLRLASTDGHNESLCLNGASLHKNHMQQIVDEGDGQSIKNQTASDYDNNKVASNLKEKSIQEGSLVEVCIEEDNPSRIAWYSAKVISLQDDKAFVCSGDFYSNSGSGKLKEWISVGGEVDKPPRIRIPHPITATKFEGTRKRRRAALGSYVWTVGDRVDAWIHDRWCEGVVTGKGKEDETKLTVCFSAAEDTATVNAWHLRPSLVWKDGQWVEYARPRDDTLRQHEGDTPQEKRPKLSKLEKENDHGVQKVGIDKSQEDLQIKLSRNPEESKPLLLSGNDKVFSFGKNSRVENNPDALRRRTGQKEGSRVVFGVPKPGKKRKFMEVSKHYVTGKVNNTAEQIDATKPAKCLPPQTSSGWKNASKIDSKGRKGSEPKLKVVRHAKSESMQTRSTSEREGSLLATMSASNDVGLNQLPTAKPSASHEEHSESFIQDSVPFTINFGTEGTTVSEGSMQSVPGVPSSRKKVFVGIEQDTVTRGKVASAFEKTRGEDKLSNFIDHHAKTVSDANELRRSRRRIQPTSRLLEGLQSSMIISKIPSVSHEKGVRASHRNLPSSKGNVHG